MILIFIPAVLPMHLWFHLRASQPMPDHSIHLGVRQQNSGVPRSRRRNAAAIHGSGQRPASCAWKSTRLACHMMQHRGKARSSGIFVEAIS